MDALRQTIAQYLKLYTNRTPAERLTIAAVSVLLVAGFAMLMLRGTGTSYDALSWGKVFTTEELALAEQALRDAGLNDFRRDGQRIMVPHKDVERYNATLVTAGSLPTHSTSELEKQLEKSNVFTSRDQLQALKDVALEKELRRVLKAVPDIEDASVRWARSESTGWLRNRSKVTATVSVRPRHGAELSPRLAQSLRAAVANMVPDLTIADVTVFDLATGTSHMPEKADDPFDSRLVQRVREFSKEYEARIRQALDYIPSVVVTVHVDVDNIRRQAERQTRINPKETVALGLTESSRNETFKDQPVRAEPGAVPNRPMSLEQRVAHETNRMTTESNSQAVTAASWTITDTELISAMPKAVRVSVAVPRDYYRSMALRNGLVEGTTEQEKKDFEKALDEIALKEEARVKQTARTLIPGGSPEDSVHVTSVVRIKPETPEVPTPWLANGIELLSDWGGVVAIVLFAAWALRMLNKSLPKLPELPPEPAASPVIAAAAAGIVAETQSSERSVEEQTARDQLQNVVRDDPESAAAVIGKWLAAAK